MNGRRTADTLRMRSSGECGRDYRLKNGRAGRGYVLLVPRSVPDIVMTNIMDKVPAQQSAADGRAGQHLVAVGVGTVEHQRLAGCHTAQRGTQVDHQLAVAQLGDGVGTMPPWARTCTSHSTGPLGGRPR